MLKRPISGTYVVHSVSDPAIDAEASNLDAYAEDLDASHLRLRGPDALTSITLKCPTVAERLDLRGRVQDLLAGADSPEDVRRAYMARHPQIAALEARRALRAVDGQDAELDADGYATPAALDLLGSPDVVLEVARYVGLLAHLNPPAGSAGGNEP